MPPKIPPIPQLEEIDWIDWSEVDREKYEGEDIGQIAAKYAPFYPFHTLDEIQRTFFNFYQALKVSGDIPDITEESYMRAVKELWGESGVEDVSGMEERTRQSLLKRRDRIKEENPHYVELMDRLAGTSTYDDPPITAMPLNLGMLLYRAMELELERGVGGGSV